MDMALMVGLSATLIIIIGLSIWSGARTKSGGQTQSGSPVVAGVIIGTLVGGSSTVGTAQLAYTYGMSAWWFTLGGGIACLILALVYAGPFRSSGCPTLVGMIRKEYGTTAGVLASILSAIGTFINIISQLISATAVIAVIAPSLSVGPALAVSAAFMVLYVVFGGTKGAGMVGVVKTALLYFAMMACGFMALNMAGGAPAFLKMVHGIQSPDGVNFLSLFARGIGTDLGACLSLILGVITTQTYAQGVLAGRTDRVGRRGALLSAFLIPPIGIGGILVGLYMRANAGLYPGMTAKTALTTFVTAHVEPLLAGIILGTLFIAVVGTGAGLALGISSILNNDIVKRVTHRFDSPQSYGLLAKVWIVLTLAVACLMSTGSMGDTILQFAFMSMGLRGAVVFMPLTCALWLPGKISPKFAVASIVVSPILVLAFGIMNVLPFDSLFVGILASAAIMILGLLAGRRTPVPRSM